MVNEEMRRHWNDTAGPEWLEREVEFVAALAPFGAELLRRAAPDAGAHVLDVGCGFGETTAAIAAAVGPRGRVMGIDISAPMLERARARTSGLTNVIWRQDDAQTAALPAGHFDLVVSRFGVMFFDDPVAALGNIRSATKPGGRLHFVCWQPAERNPWYTLPSRVLAPYLDVPAPAAGGPGPFAFADPARVRAILTDAGWHSVAIDGFDASMVEGAGGPVDRVIRHMVRGPVAAALAAAPEERRVGGLAALRRAVQEHIVAGEARFAAAAWLVAARA